MRLRLALAICTQPSICTRIRHQAAPQGLLARIPPHAPCARADRAGVVRVRTGQGVEKQAGTSSGRDARPSLKLRTAGGAITSRRLRPRSTRPRPRALGQVSGTHGTPCVSGVSCSGLCRRTSTHRCSVVLDDLLFFLGWFWPKNIVLPNPFRPSAVLTGQRRKERY